MRLNIISTKGLVVCTVAQWASSGRLSHFTLMTIYNILLVADNVFDSYLRGVSMICLKYLFLLCV